MSTCIIAGRGPTSATVGDLPRYDIMAVSSGVFALPRRPVHFVTVDAPKYFMDDLDLPYAGGWWTDDRCAWWDMLHDGSVAKHVPGSKNRPGYNRHMPKGQTPATTLEDFMAAMGMADERPDLLGFQPGWGDYGNVHGWPYNKQAPPSFIADGPMGAKDAPWQRSLWLAVQLVPRLGYNRVIFAGVDLHRPHLACEAEVLSRWRDLADNEGIAWAVSSERSRLSEFLPVDRT